jgi:murein L,D-transpeptidase YafK
MQEGDLQSPEGFYVVAPKQMNPRSRYHLSFNLGYPNAYDRAHARTGNALMVHGDCVSAGCYAMTNRQMEEIYLLADAALRHGQPFFRVHVFPFRMTADRMQRQQGSPWFTFWENLKEAYDLFERHGRPANVLVQSQRYLFE